MKNYEKERNFSNNTLFHKPIHNREEKKINSKNKPLYNMKTNNNRKMQHKNNFMSNSNRPSTARMMVPKK